MIGMSFWILMGASLISLVGFVFSGVLVSQAHARRQKTAKRMSEVVAPFRKSRVMEMQAFRSAPARDRSLVESAASVFGFNPARQNQYPVRWWIVLCATFVIARGTAGFAVDILGPIGLVSMPVLWVAMCRFFFGWAIGRRKALLVKQFPDVLAMIVRSLRVGIPVVGAMSVVAREAQAPTSVEFTKFANDLSIGVSLSDASKEMGIRNDLSEYRFFAIAIGLQTQTGGGLSETLENLADLMRKRLALRERGHALSSEARTSAIVLGALPIILGGGIWAMNPEYMDVLFTTGTGHKILGAAMLSLGFGAMSMRTIIQKTLS
jgi:tight adherence protein B